MVIQGDTWVLLGDTKWYRGVLESHRMIKVCYWVVRGFDEVIQGDTGVLQHLTL